MCKNISFYLIHLFTNHEEVAIQKFKLLIAATGISALLVFSFAMADHHEEAELKKIIDTGLAALNADDMDAFAALHMQDETTVHIGPIAGDLNKGWTAAKQSFQGLMASPAKLTKHENVAIKMLGDAAWGVWTFTTEMEMEGKTMSTPNRLTIVFERVGDKWLVSHFHASAGLPPAAPPMTEK